MSSLRSAVEQLLLGCAHREEPAAWLEPRAASIRAAWLEARAASIRAAWLEPRAASLRAAWLEAEAASFRSAAVEAELGAAASLRAAVHRVLREAGAWSGRATARLPATPLVAAAPLPSPTDLAGDRVFLVRPALGRALRERSGRGPGVCTRLRRGNSNWRTLDDALAQMGLRPMPTVFSRICSLLAAFTVLSQGEGELRRRYGQLQNLTRDGQDEGQLEVLEELTPEQFLNLLVEQYGF